MTALVVYLQNTIARLRERQEGQTMAEYALILGGIAVVVIAAIVFLGDNILRAVRGDRQLGHEPGLVDDAPRASGGSPGLPAPREPPQTRCKGASKSALEETRDRADDERAAGRHDSPNLAASCGVPTRRGLAVRRIDVRRDEGVAMAEFALILPVFLTDRRRAALLRTGLLLLDPRRTTSRTRPRVGRWSTGTRTRARRSSRPRPTARRSSSRTAQRSASTSRQGRGDGRSRRPGPGASREAVHRPADPEHRHDHHPRHVHDADRELRQRHRRSPDVPHERQPAEPGDVHMSRSLRDERGGILVLSAVLIPLFLVFTALVIDVGDWFTHKRQLQNRADAAAFAAGTEYAQRLEGLRPDRRRRPQAEHGQRDRRRGPPVRGRSRGVGLLDRRAPHRSLQHGDREPVEARCDGQLGQLQQLHGRHGLHGRRCRQRREPVLRAPDRGRRLGARLLDRRQGEGARPALAVRRDRPAALAQHRPRARRDPPAISGHRFLPLAVPDNVITKVQVRYYNECTGAEIASARYDLAPLPTADQSAFVTAGGGTLWGLPSAADPTVGDKNLSFNLVLPATPRRAATTCRSASRCGSRAATTSTSNQSCAPLVAAGTPTASIACRRSASGTTATRDSQIRDPRITLSGGCGAPATRTSARSPSQRSTASTTSRSRSTGALAARVHRCRRRTSP